MVSSCDLSSPVFVSFVADSRTAPSVGKASALGSTAFQPWKENKLCTTKNIFKRLFPEALCKATSWTVELYGGVYGTVGASLAPWWPLSLRHSSEKFEEFTDKQVFESESPSK